MHCLKPLTLVAHISRIIIYRRKAVMIADDAICVTQFSEQSLAKHHVINICRTVIVRRSGVVRQMAGRSRVFVGSKMDDR